MKKLLNKNKKEIRFDSLIKIKDDSKKYTLKYLKESKSVNLRFSKKKKKKKKKIKKFTKLKKN